MKYKWLIKESIDSKIITQLLYNRGIIEKNQIEEYLFPEKYIESKPEEIGDLLKAKDRIIKAITNNEKITIFGDYDVDGITSTSCLLLTLKSFTSNVDFYIPNRLKEGYGLNEDAVKKIAKKKTNLLITCDCGITNNKEITLANELGMDVIVTDHHSLPETLPPAIAVLNPKFLPENHKLHYLPGVGVAYKLCEEIIKDFPDSKIQKEDLLDLVTLGMIADIVPLVGENRYLVQIGISRLAHTNKKGLKELLNVCGLKKENGVSTENIGFGIAPRINAVGRITDAALGVQLLTTDDEIEALHLATQLDIQNKERQIICEETFNDVVDILELREQKDKCIVLAKEGWHHGVIGIVASRILERYHLPTLLICIDEENIGRGSGRSIESLNIVDALHENKNFLERYGGHKVACGLSIKKENIENFIQSFTETINSTLSNANLEPTLKIDAKIELHEISHDLIDEINVLSPFGLANPLPVFAAENIEIANIRQIGKDGRHLKLFLKDLKSQRFFEALIWNYNSRKDSNLKPKDKLKIAFTPKINFFNNEKFVQLEIKDWDVLESPKIDKIVESDEIRIFDYRGKLQECLDLMTNRENVGIFAEQSQKTLLPIKTNSRLKLGACETLIMADFVPDERTLVDLIIKSKAKEIYFSFNKTEILNLEDHASNILKKLSGMFLFVANQKNGIIGKADLESALGLSRIAITYALEILAKSEFLTYSQSLSNINISILKTSCQINTKLIEYNLFLDELKEIFNFHNKLFKYSLNELKAVVNKAYERTGRFLKI